VLASDRGRLPRRKLAQVRQQISNAKNAARALTVRGSADREFKLCLVARQINEQEGLRLCRRNHSRAIVSAPWRGYRRVRA